jgi:ATP/maltotriose-dependent transcriptional regulator MalT
MKVRTGWLLAFFLSLSSYTFALSNIALSSLVQKGRHYDLIRILQSELDQGHAVSTFQLAMLGHSYYQVRQYRNAGAIADTMDQRIAAGDSSYFGSDLSIFPELLRASISLDQGDNEAAAGHADNGYRHLKPNQFLYRWGVIQLAGVRGLAQAFLGHTDAARQDLELIGKVSTFMTNIGPEKYTAMARIHMALKQYDKALADVGDEGARISSMLSLFYDPSF